jgi:hypothetical protein
MLALLMGGIYIRRWDRLKCLDIRSKLKKDWFSCSKINWGDTHTQTHIGSHKPTFIFENEESRLKL